MCISYDEVQRCRTSLASYTIETCKSSVPLPSHFDPVKFTTAAFDNFDHEEATESGMNGTHDTVAVLFQEKSETIKRKPNISETNINYSARSFNEELQCQRLKQFYKDPGPVSLPQNYSQATKSLSREVYVEVRADDMAWSLCRMDISEAPDQINKSKNVQETPSWSAFNSFLTEDTRTQQNVGFLPILPYPVTDFATVYTALCNFKDILFQLNQQNLPVFCDEGVYRIARQIKFLREKEFEHIHLMLGSFHMIKIVLACIGRYIRGSGVENIFIETGAFGVGTTEQVLNGTNYARSVRGFFLLGEALQRLQLESYFENRDLKQFEQHFLSLQVLQDTFVEKNLAEGRAVYEHFKQNSQELTSDFRNFVLTRCKESDLFNYWNNILVLIGLVQNMIRADRTGNWILHLNTVEKLQPIFHAMDRTNYARWSSVYIHDMLVLKETAPDIYNRFMEGQFTVKHSDTSFSSVGTDQALEQTINRSKKSSSGIIGSTRKKQFVAAWDLVYHEILAITNLYREKTYLKNDNYELKLHHEYSTKKNDRTEQLLTKMLQYISERVNPFMDGSQPLKNIVTQECTSAETSKALLNIFDTGCKVYEQFRKERFEDFTKPISSTITRVKLPSFKAATQNSVQKELKVKKKPNKDHRIFDLARERGYSIKSLLSFELTYENPLFEENDILKKETQKSNIFDELQKILDNEEYILEPDSDKFCLMVDVMMGLRKLQWKNMKTFQDLAKSFCSMIRLTLKGHFRRIDFVFDSYIEMSPKSGERLRRYGQDYITIHKIEDDVPLPVQMKKFWACTENKVILQTYLRNYILQHGDLFWPEVELICSATNAEECQTNLSHSQLVLDMLQNHDIEEADTRMMLHIMHASNKGHEKIYILSSDTDIVIMALYFLQTFKASGLKVTLKDIFILFF